MLVRDQAGERTITMRIFSLVDYAGSDAGSDASIPRIGVACMGNTKTSTRTHLSLLSVSHSIGHETIEAATVAWTRPYLIEHTVASQSIFSSSSPRFFFRAPTVHVLASTTDMHGLGYHAS